jgi:hypothetical protein
MKTMEELENELRSWAPRPPSARLRAKVFGQPTVEPSFGWSQARVAFASAVAVALVIAIRQGSPSFSSGSQASPAMLAAVMSNQNLAAYAVRQDNQGLNTPASMFEGTNLGDSIVPTHFIRANSKQ